MTKITVSGKEIVKVVVVSGGVLFLALSGTSILQKFIFVKYPIAVAQSKLVKGICRLPIALFPSTRDAVISELSRKGSTSPVSQICCNKDSNEKKTFITFEGGNSKFKPKISNLLNQEMFKTSTSCVNQATLDAGAVRGSVEDGEEDEDERGIFLELISNVAPAESNLSGIREHVREKKKVHFAASVIEPKGDNREYRRNPKSSQRRPTLLLSTTRKPLLRRVNGAGLMHSNSQSVATESVQSSDLDSLNCSHADRRSLDVGEKSSKIRTLFGSQLPANRIALYAGMYPDRFQRALV
ncbi:hypothetical protein O6H91_10G038600 [Diphasiastrum complanatum]|nr:hypothetical protein O6H91_10G037800 [Diphasiastrum complanatum]KAJ7540957.1 hypothetical protein O6H91_10G038600 [Diphasiastrum complanatum]